MKNLVVYVHGKGGSAQEAEHYKSLFPKDEVIGFDYRSQTPWQAKKEFFAFFTEQRGRCEHLTLVANSIGAFFALSSLDETLVDRAYFISPIVDMENLICNTSGLDPESAQNVNSLIQEQAAEGITVFLCTHQLRYAQEICTTYGLMNKGRLFAAGDITELRSMACQNTKVRIKASRMPKDMIYQEIGDHVYDMEVTSEHDIPLIVKRIVEAGGDLYHVSEQQMSLEEIYFSLIDREHAETERENT